MKIDLKKLETAFTMVVRKHIFFLCCELFPAFLHFSNTTSCHWLSVNKIEGKIKRLFELGTFTANKSFCQGLFNLQNSTLAELVDKNRKEMSKP